MADRWSPSDAAGQAVAGAEFESPVGVTEAAGVASRTGVAYWWGAVWLCG